MARERTQLDTRHTSMSMAHEDHAELVQVARIRTDGGTQMRAEIDEAVVREYASLMKDKHVFPPIDVYFDGTNYWLADGFHRLLAWELSHQEKKIPVEKIACHIHGGDRRDAILHAAGANARHGLRRTNADKRRSVGALLRDKEWQHWSNREIAKACGVSDRFVGKMREAHGGTSNESESLIRKTADGRVMDTSNIGPRREIKPIRETSAQRQPVTATPPVYTGEPPQPDSQPTEQMRYRTAKLVHMSECCSLVLDGLSDFEEETGHIDTSEQAREILRKIQAQISNHIDRTKHSRT